MLKITSVVMLLATTPAAGLEWPDFDRFSKDLQYAYIRGVAEGIAASNATLSYTGQQRLFCTPDYLEITLDEHWALANKLRAGDFGVELSMLIAMMDAWPCD